MEAEPGEEDECEEVQQNGDEPKADGEFRKRIEKRAGNHHERHREGRHDGPDHRVLQVSPERVGVKRKAADEKEEERGRNGRPGILSPAMKGKRISRHQPRLAMPRASPAMGVGRLRTREGNALSMNGEDRSDEPMECAFGAQSLKSRTTAAQL